jgi:4'-phosphopantetheinyl transferase EntD
VTTPTRSLSLQELLASLFPPFVIVKVAGPGDDDESLLPPEESRWLAPMAPVRRHEFTMGRNAARRALERLGVPRVAICRRSDDRDPEWPAGIVGSISHSHGVAVAACARVSDVLAIGLDVERAGPLGDDVVREICRNEELEALGQLEPPKPSDWPKLLFAVKEAGYKAWFPRTRAPLDFHSMHVTLDPRSRRFTATVQHEATAHLSDAPWVLEGRFGWNAEVVLAGAVIRRVG